MGNLCSSGQKIQLSIQAELDALLGLDDNMLYALLLTPDGKFISSQMNRATTQPQYDKHVAAIQAFQTTAPVFYQSLQHNNNDTTHVRSEDYIYSSYKVLEGYSLSILFNRSKNDTQLILDRSQQDAKISDFLTTSLEPLVAQLHTSTL